MSQFIKKLKEIKKEVFHLNDFYIYELIELFDFKNNEDKNFILGNNEKSNLYEGDIYSLLKSLLNEEKLKGYEDEIIENYKSKYLNNNSSITRAYCLVYLELFIDYYKTKDYKSLFRELYDNSDNDLIEKFINIFRKIEDNEYFIKSFNIFLGQETRYGNKYLPKANIEFLLNLKDEYFLSFLNNISNEGFVYLKEFDGEYSNTFIRKIQSLGNADINNKLKNQFLEVIGTAFGREDYDYERYKITEDFVKSTFGKSLNKYLGEIFTHLSLELIDKLSESLGYWDIITLISDILNTDNIVEIINKSGDDFFVVSIYEQIEGGTRNDKKYLLDEFKKYDDFNKKLEKRKEFLESNKGEQEKKQNKEKENFFTGINEIIETEKNKPKWISEYLLYHFDENTYKIQENKEIIKVVKKQVRRFFKLSYSDPEKYELNYTKRDQNGSSYTTHQFVVNHTFIRCLKFYKQFGFKIKEVISKKAIRYVPFAYSDDLEYIFSIIGDNELEKDDVDYLLSIYNGSRTKDDLKYNNISTFTLFYEKYKSSFIKYGKTATQETFINIINDTQYNGYERKYTAEKLADIGEERQLLELFNKYKTDEKYFSNIEKQEIELAIISSKALIKNFPKTESKKTIIDWYIKQLNAKVILHRDDSEGMHTLSELEAELSWDLKEEKSFISVFKYINDLTFENDIKDLLSYSFKLIKESKKDYKIFGNYIQQAVFNFYEGIEKKNLKKIFELEKEISNDVKDDETRILFKVNFLDKLITIYSENVDKLEINRIYKSVYSVKKDSSKENQKLKEELIFLKNEKLKLEKDLKSKNQTIIQLEGRLDTMQDYSDNNIILFVEGESDKIILKNAWKKLYPDKNMNFNIVNGFDRFFVGNTFSRGDIFKKNYITFIGMLDFDDGYENYEKLLDKKDGKSPNYEIYKNDEKKGLTLKHKKEKGYLFLLPIPEFRTIYASKKQKSRSNLSIEFLFNDELIKNYLEHKAGPMGIKIPKFKDIKKVSFANETTNFNDNLFHNFIPIFDLINEIIADSKKSQKS